MPVKVIGLLICIAVAVALTVGSAAAEGPQIRVLALFPGKAMLSIDGKRRLLGAGESSPEGVELVAADPQRAVIRYAGEERALQPGGAVSATYARPEHREVKVVRNSRGAYEVAGRINGQTVQFLVDTGASIVALGEQQARRLGIAFELYGEPMQVRTASGMSRAYRVNLDRVQVGDIELRNVEGSVIMDGGPPAALLGMSFLNRLQFENQGNLMVLRQKF
jgi:aspartyl protease family protein